MNSDKKSTMPIKNKRRGDIDAIKAIAIIAVVLYHMGIAKYGYLGVDVFLVISGFLLMNSLKQRSSKFSYFREIGNRLMRLYPLIIVASAVCLIIGFFVMLPDDYDNLSQSVVATELSANNILAYITTGNYWEVVNELKPLMHTWYIGVLVQFYVVFLLIYKAIVTKAAETKRKKIITITLSLITIASFCLYLLPVFNNNLKFYMLPFRIWELSLGCLVAHLYDKLCNRKLNRYFIVSLPILLIILFIPFGGGIIDILRLILTVICTVSLFLYTDENTVYAAVMNNPIFCAIGKASFSIYIWHQIILAFTRYTITAEFNLLSGFIFLLVTAVSAVLSYALIEKQLGAFIKKYFKKAVIVIVVLSVFITSAALFIYTRAGVVRDVPELDISTDNITRGMHSQYNHRIYALENKPFENNGKVNVLIVGNSYARDMANILLESEMSSEINISYAYSWNEEMIPIIQNADYIFSQKLTKEELPLYVLDNFSDEDNIFGIGTKRYGENNGIIYSQRHKDGYLSMTVEVPDSILDANEVLRSSWGDNYVNFIEMVQNDDGTVPVFTTEGKYISQDCWHLTKAGAMMYAELIDWSSIFD